MEEKEFWKYMEGNITGWTAYAALEKVLVKWHKISGEEYALFLASCLASDAALQNDWAEAMKEAIEERGANNISVLKAKRLQ